MLYHEILKDLRLRKGLTLRALAKEVGISPAYLNQIENGVKIPSFKTLKKLASYYGLEVKDLVVAEKERKYSLEESLEQRILRYLRKLPHEYLEKILEFVKFQYQEWKRARRSRIER